MKSQLQKGVIFRRELKFDISLMSAFFAATVGRLKFVCVLPVRCVGFHFPLKIRLALALFSCGIVSVLIYVSSIRGA
jgi:hypothetical protein